MNSESSIYIYMCVCVYITMCKIHSLWETAIQHRELSSALCDDQQGDDLYGGGREAPEGGDIGVLRDDSCSRAETSTTLYSTYTPIKIKKKKKASWALWPSGPELTWSFQGRKDLKSGYKSPAVCLAPLQGCIKSQSIGPSWARHWSPGWTLEGQRPRLGC